MPKPRISDNGRRGGSGSRGPRRRWVPFLGLAAAVLSCTDPGVPSEPATPVPNFEVLVTGLATGIVLNSATGTEVLAIPPDGIGMFHGEVAADRSMAIVAFDTQGGGSIIWKLALPGGATAWTVTIARPMHRSRANDMVYLAHVRSPPWRRPDSESAGTCRRRYVTRRRTGRQPR